jgi:DNA-binding transcriptional MerR regulator
MLPMIDGALPTRDSPDIPNKLYFRIGEVAKLAGIKPYVLRFWETEFPGLGPKKSGTGHRLYRRKDVELVLEIKRLLYEKRYTIEGARKFLGSQPKPSAAKPASPPRKQRELFDSHPPQLAEIRKELAEILQVLASPDTKKL